MNIATKLVYEFPVTGSVPANIVWLDLECCKVIAPASWQYKTRTSAFMVGLGYFTANSLRVEIIMGDENLVMQAIRDLCSGKTVVYTATHSYDKLVVEGKWTFIRRGPSATPGEWANVQGLNWQNTRKTALATKNNPIVRSFDIASKDVPTAWENGDLDAILIHNLRDVLEMVLTDIRTPKIVLNPIILGGNVAESLSEAENNLTISAMIQN